ncbi:hypothetical protein Acsp03_53310 [Actinomadura sp. NBRC 104412]|nr:hypothetical protein Acsp03_53310 [Actinomadura sp. NBRC 104412]
MFGGVADAGAGTAPISTALITMLITVLIETAPRAGANGSGRRIGECPSAAVPGQGADPPVGAGPAALRR